MPFGAPPQAPGPSVQARALTQAEAATDALQVERDELQTDLSEAQASVVDDANPFATQADLDGFREILAGYRETIASAATIDELTPLFVTFDSDFDRLVSLNVTADLSECKGVLANNGFATTGVIASTISNLFELDPMLVADVQAEIASSDELAETVFDQACAPVPGG